MTVSRKFTTFLFILVTFCLTVVVCRQKCLTCQFVLNGPGKECVTAPHNWTGGDPRMRCPNKCTIMAEYDATSKTPTFFHRGCGVASSTQQDGCLDNGARHSCFYSCEGTNYCNDQALPTSPLVDPDDDVNASSPLRLVSFYDRSLVFLMATVFAVVMATP